MSERQKKNKQQKNGNYNYNERNDMLTSKILNFIKQKILPNHWNTINSNARGTGKQNPDVVQCFGINRV